MTKNSAYQEEPKTGVNNVPTESQPEVGKTPEADPESIGWAEGMADAAPEGSKGWVEGMAKDVPENSIGWSEGMADEAPDDSEGWVEGYGPAKTPAEPEAKKYLQSGENLLGKSAISLKDGRVVGTIKEFYLDPNLEFITAVQLGGEGLFDLRFESLFKHKFRLVRSDKVALFGVDVILITDADAVVDSDQVPEVEQWLKLSDLKGREVDTPGGTHIGTVGDIIFKPGQGGYILGFTLIGVFVDGPLAQSRAIARNVVIEPGNEKDLMTIDLAKAEQQDLSKAMIA